ncbi:hypothetical protein HK405_010491, partial [Cladochytrium tenue]
MDDDNMQGGGRELSGLATSAGEGDMQPDVVEESSVPEDTAPADDQVAAAASEEAPSYKKGEEDEADAIAAAGVARWSAVDTARAEQPTAATASERASERGSVVEAVAVEEVKEEADDGAEARASRGGSQAASQRSSVAGTAPAAAEAAADLPEAAGASSARRSVVSSATRQLSIEGLLVDGASGIGGGGDGSDEQGTLEPRASSPASAARVSLAALAMEQGDGSSDTAVVAVEALAQSTSRGSLATRSAQRVGGNDDGATAVRSASRSRTLLSGEPAHPGEEAAVDAATAASTRQSLAGSQLIAGGNFADVSQRQPIMSLQSGEDGPRGEQAEPAEPAELANEGAGFEERGSLGSRRSLAGEPPHAGEDAVTGESQRQSTISLRLSAELIKRGNSHSSSSLAESKEVAGVTNASMRQSTTSLRSGNGVPEHHSAETEAVQGTGHTRSGSFPSHDLLAEGKKVAVAGTSQRQSTASLQSGQENRRNDAAKETEATESEESGSFRSRHSLTGSQMNFGVDAVAGESRRQSTTFQTGQGASQTESAEITERTGRAESGLLSRHSLAGSQRVAAAGASQRQSTTLHRSEVTDGTENKFHSRHSLTGSQTGADANVAVSASQRQSTTSLRSGRGDPAQEAASENDDSHADGALRSRHSVPGGSQRQSTASLRSSHGTEQQGMTDGNMQNEHGARRDPAEVTDEAEIHDGWSHDEAVEKSLSRKGTSTRGSKASLPGDQTLKENSTTASRESIAANINAGEPQTWSRESLKRENRTSSAARSATRASRAASLQ